MTLKMPARKAIDVVLIKPGNPKQIYGALASDLHAIEPPLWAILLAAYLREKGYTVEVIDAEADELSLDACAKKVQALNPRLIGFIVSGSNLSASTWNMPATHDYAQSLKRHVPDIPVFYWGLHPSALPERTLAEEKIDYVIKGEGFITLPPLLDFLKGDAEKALVSIPGLAFWKESTPIVNISAPVVSDLNSLPMPAWDLLPMSKYRAHNWHCFDAPDRRQPYAVIYASLGCPFDCHFCALKTLFGKSQIRYRDPKLVVAEIDVLVQKYHVRNIKILDECFVLNKNHVMEFCDLLIDRKYDLNMWAYARIDTVDEPILQKMKQAGMNWLAYGIEAGSKKVREGVAKGRFTQDKISEVVRQTKEAGIAVCGNFMFGLPDDDRETMQETLSMAKELNCEYTNFYVTMAYPGSALYEDAIKNNTKLPDMWGGYSQFSEETYPLPTKHLSPADVLRFRDQAFHDFHSSEGYQAMMKEKYGEKTVTHINEMLKVKLKRKYA